MPTCLLDPPSRSLPAGPVLARASLLESCRRSAPATARPAREQPFEGACGVRLFDGSDHGNGYMDAASFRERLLVTIHDRHFAADFVSKVAMDGWLSLHFRLSGESTHLFEGIGQVHRTARTCMVIAYPPGVTNCEWFAANTHLRAVGIAAEPGMLSEEFGVPVQSLPPELRGWLGAGRKEFFSAQIPFTTAMHQAVTDLIEMPYTGRLRYRYVEARTLELACLAVHGIAIGQEQPSRVIRLTRHERQRLHDVRDLLLSSFHASPTIVELAREAAMNRTKLQSGFRQLFGTSIFEFCSELRMQRARELLRDGDLTVAQVAYRVGYQHPNNFTAAFKRRFGFLPRDGRQHGSHY